VVPPLALFAAAGLAAMIGHVREGKLKSYLPELAVIVVALVLGLAPTKESRDPPGRDYAEIGQAYSYNAGGDLRTALRWYDLAAVNLTAGDVDMRKKIMAYREELGWVFELLEKGRNSDDPEQLAQWAQELEKKRYYLPAIELYERAVALRPDLIKPRTRLGIIRCDLFEFRDINQGLTHLSAILSRHPDHLEAMSSIANCYLRAGDAAQARQWLEYVVAADPGRPAAAEQLEQLRKPWR
jgi:tetratricopeptide (TPR) repeat protein